MLKHLILIAATFISCAVFAQKNDSIFVMQYDNGWAIKHKVKTGENIFAIARRYYAPPAIIADANGISFQQQLVANTFIIVPLGAYNFLNATPQTNDAKPLYFKVNNEGLYKIARTTGVTQKQIQEWNALMTNEIRKGQQLMIGWVRFDNTNLQPKPPVTKNTTTNSGIKIQEDDPSNRRRSHTPEVIYIPLPDTTALQLDTLTEGEEQFSAQTQNGAVIVEEKGTVAFFRSGAQSEDDIYYAFHNTARRGTIIKIHNPGNDKTVYAKVIGKVPTTGTFHNAILGISADAKPALGTMGDKVWCELIYAP